MYQFVYQAKQNQLCLSPSLAKRQLILKNNLVHFRYSRINVEKSPYQFSYLEVGILYIYH